MGSDSLWVGLKMKFKTGLLFLRLTNKSESPITGDLLSDRLHVVGLYRRVVLCYLSASVNSKVNVIFDNGFGKIRQN